MDRHENRITEENAADRMTYVGEITTIGEKARKKEILDNLPEEWSKLHNNGYIHIHDLDAYGYTYNCLAFDISSFFPFERFENVSIPKKIIGVFDFLKEYLTKLGNEQSGGMGFANFDNEIASILDRLSINAENLDLEILKASINSFISWCNNSHERMGKVSYYVSLNLGLSVNKMARLVCYTVLDEFEHTDSYIFKPNIIFKVKKGINLNKSDTNYDLFQKALHVTTIKMIPTYILCDSKPNKDFDPFKIVIMGCRTRVIANKYGEPSSIGRGNITNISLNLTRLALESSKDLETKINTFYNKVDDTCSTIKDILEDRYYRLIKNRSNEDFLINSTYDAWIKSFKTNSLDDIFINGTLSIGFIGLAETVEVLTGKKMHQDNEAYNLGIEIVKHLRKIIDNLTLETRFNYSLLATSGELISGRFTELDIKAGFNHEVTKKNYYTNSFHIEVNSGLSTFKKIEMEAPFHDLCNGGCISYLELKEAPINNESALEELINHGIQCGTHYLGFNFDLDICNDCNFKGVFDVCPKCNGENITRIRRVSGYIEILDYFTKGKKNEVKNRTRNEDKLCMFR